jgi:DNA primase small subunit
MTNEEAFIKDKFRQYYFSAWTKGPVNINMREFGFGTWSKTIESRHFSFANEKELNGYLARNTPFFISYSVAFYRYPSARPIQKKEWINGEIVFDIDANQLGESCVKVHGADWICDRCMDKAKENALKLIEEYLIGEFGVKEESLSVNFSGNRGYHIHLMGGFEDLNSYARRELADYVNGRGVEYADLFVEDKLRRKETGPKPTEGGWKGKFAKTFLDYLTKRRLEELGVHSRTADRFYEKVDAAKHIENGNWDAVFISNRKKFVEKLIEEVTKRKGCSVDEVVTIDTSKLIRMPDSIHGKTGLLAKRMQLKDLKNFDYSRDPIIFNKSKGSEIKVNIAACNEINLNGQTFGPYKDQTVELPEYAAIYLLCKKVATLAQSAP